MLIGQISEVKGALITSEKAHVSYLKRGTYLRLKEARSMSSKQSRGKM